MQATYSSLIQQLHEFAKTYQFQRAVVGLSGGLDSAVTYLIAIRAFGPQNVTALILPEVGLTSNDDVDHAKRLATHFKSPMHYQPINNFLVDFNFVTWEKSEESNRLLKSQIRAVLLTHYARAHNALLLGTANKSDFSLGYGNPDGEFVGDVHVLGDLYKTDVLELAKDLGLPQELILKPYSRRLHPYQTDEGELGAPWTKIDDILRQLEEGVDPESMIQKGMDALTVHKIVRILQQNEKSPSSAPILHGGKIKEALKKAREVEASSS